MPDNMSPENSQGQIPPSVKAVMNFGAEEARNFPRPSAVVEFPGAAEQRKAAEEFPRLEYKSELPDIRMQQGEDDRDPQKERLEHELRFQGMYGESGDMRALLGDVKRLKQIEDSELKSKPGEAGLSSEDIERIKNEMLEKERESIAEKYRSVLHKSLDEIESLNKHLENLHNPYPYDSRWAIQFFEQGLEQVNDGLRNPEKISTEGKAILKLLKRDVLWALSAAKVTEAMGPAFETYFDGEMELSRLRTAHTELTAEDFMRMFGKDLPGEDLTKPEIELVKKTLNKNGALEFKAKNEAGTSVEKIGLREVAVEMQDRYGKLLYQIVGVGQKNLELVGDTKTFKETGVNKESGEHYADFDRVTYEFLSEVFNVKSVFNPVEFMGVGDNGNVVVADVSKQAELRQKAFESIKYKDKAGINANGYKVKEAILNPFCMDPRSDEIAGRTFRARVQELVFNSDKYSESLKKIKEDFEANRIDEAQLTALIQEEAGKVFDITDIKIANWESNDEAAPFIRLTDTVVRSLNNLEHGTLASGDLGWAWRYDKISPLEIKDDGGRAFIVVDTKLNGEKVRWYQDAVDGEVWDTLTTKILFKESKLGRDGRTFFVDDHGRSISTKKTEFSQGEWDNLSPAQKTAKHASHEFSPTEWTLLSSKTINTETGNTGIDTNRLQIDTATHIQSFVKRKSELGSIYDNHDVTTVMFLARHLIDYDTLADTRSTIFPPTISWYRELWASEPPYWRPEIENFAPNDHELKKMLGIEGNTGITSPGNVLENKVGRGAYSIGESKRGEQKFGRYDPKAAEFVKENAWAFVTPFLEKPGDANSDYLVLPIFLPTQIKDMNFWRMVSLEEPSAKLRKNLNKSIWHKRLGGEKLSNLKWENMDKYKYSWAVVTNDQMERWLGPLATPHDFNRMTADEVKKHYMMPSGKSEKEAGKRARLGGRGGTVEEGVLRATVFSQNKIIFSMGVSNVLSAPDMKQDVDTAMSKWTEAWIAPWINVMLDMPSVVRGCTNYGGTAAQSAIVTYLQMERIARSIIKTGYQQVGNVSASLITIKKALIGNT